jgi:cytochrome c oxidase cbb3-type subunit 2
MTGLFPRIGAILLGAISMATGADADNERPPLPDGFAYPDRNFYQQGKYVYRQNCMICHGERGDGNGEMASQLDPKPRQFSIGIFKYRSTPPGKLPTDDDLLRTVREGRSGTAMGIFGHLPEEDLRAVVEYVKFFSRRWRKAENYAAALTIPEAPKWFDDKAERSRRVEAGRSTFAASCASCHGPTGEGDGPAAAALMDAWGAAIRPANLRVGNLRSGKELRDLYRTITTGLDGTPMVSFATALTDEQRWELVAYITALRAPEGR